MLELNPPALQLVTRRHRISLDSPGELAFVSHAHSDHVPKGKGLNSTFIASKQTVELMAVNGKKVTNTVESYSNDGLDVKMLDSGHILGSKQLFAKWDSHSFLYSGDFKLQDSLTRPGAEVVESETVLLETTYGIPEYVFPARDEVYNEIATWVKQEQAKGHNVLLGGYAIGKAQELVAVLNQYVGVTPVVTKKVFDACEVYSRHGVKMDCVCTESEEGIEVLDGGSFVSVVPMHLASPEVCGELTRAYGRKTVAGVSSGWALNNWFKGVKAFCLSDHADHDQLVEYVERTNAKKVYTTHGFAKEFAAELRKKGRDAVALEELQTQKIERRDSAQKKLQ